MIFKFFLFNLSVFLLAANLFAAIEIPVALTGKFRDGGRQFFVIGLPLKPGEISDLKHLQLVDEKGEEIPVQTALISRWPDGSCRWVRLCGLLDFAPGGERRVTVEIGSDVLRSMPRGIIKAESSDKMLIDAGRLTVQLRTDSFSLPERISMDGADLGTFAPFKSSGSLPEFELIEAGPLYMVVEMRDSKGVIPLRYRLHFIWNEAMFMVECIGPRDHSRDGGVRFINWKEFSFSEKWHKNRALFCYGFGRKPAAEIEAVTGIIDRRELEDRTLLCSGNDLPPELRIFEQQLLDYVRKEPAAVPAESLSGAFFRTGDVNFLQTAVQRFNDRREEAPGELIAHCPGWKAPGLSRENKKSSPLSSKLWPESGRITAAELAEFLAPDGRVFQRLDENFSRGAALLLRGFDPASAGWLSAIDLRGGPVRDSVPAGMALNIRIIRIMLKMASFSDDPAWSSAALTALKHLSVCGVTPSSASSPELFALLAECGAYFKQQPEALKRFAAGKPDSLLPERGRYDLKLKVDREFSAEVIPLAGQSVKFRAVLQNGAAGGKAVLRSSDNRMLGQFNADRSGRLEFSIAGAGGLLQMLLRRPQFCKFELGSNMVFKLPFSSSPWYFRDLRSGRFRMVLKTAETPLRLRIRSLKAGEYAGIILVSPSGRRQQLSDRNPDGESVLLAPELVIAKPEPGIWQLSVVSSGADFVLSASGADGAVEY